MGSAGEGLLPCPLSVLVSPPPPSEQAVGIVTLGLWLFVPWGYWIDRHREPRREPAAVAGKKVRAAARV
jgi:hypothetical protein